jgi:small subunit ribosomal protein S9
MVEKKIKEKQVKKQTKEKKNDQEAEDKKGVERNEIVEFSGKYVKAVGRRKRAVAQVRMYEGGRGVIMINGQKAVDYFSGEGHNIIAQPLKVTGHQRDYDFSILVKGGGKSGQVGAIKLGIARAILEIDPKTKEALRANNFLTRDSRQVERKKPGLKKARKAPQWSKR